MVSNGFIAIWEILPMCASLEGNFCLGAPESCLGALKRFCYAQGNTCRAQKYLNSRPEIGCMIFDC